LSTLHLHGAIPCIAALAGILAFAGESSAAARERPLAGAAKPSWHHALMARSGAHGSTHELGRTIALRAAPQVAEPATRHGRRQHAPEVAHNVAPESRHGFSGFASYYGEGQSVASGGKFNPTGFTCAHRSLPFGTHLRVADSKSGRSVVVTVNDRGPFVRGRILDLSLGAARALGMVGRGITHVSASVI
jgi:rare lipoprotein A (peptidoglycan hydrolase)